jgi:DNA-binding winged helix-turn-helix (wHTH) protein/TolB-like protein
MAGVRFGRFEFDTQALELKRDGVPVRLQPQPAQVLAVLLERAGTVVPRDELRQLIWGKETHVDFDQGLNYCVAQVRTALGDSGEASQFVRTIPKRGYQFIAPILQQSALTPPGPVPEPRKAPVPAWAVAAGVLLAAAGVLAAALWLRAAPVNIAIARFDNETGLGEMTAFSDGLTDMVVAQLTTEAGSRFGIIGNAAALRKPREERDLKALGTSLNAGYVVLGQVQKSSGGIRVLAHLIRLPDQTHVAVVRLDRDIRDSLQTQSEVSRKIADEFLRRLPSSHGFVSH